MALVGLLFPSGSDTEEKPGPTVRLLIQQGSFDRALEALPAQEPDSGQTSHLFQRAYCLQQLARWGEAADIYQHLLTGHAPGDTCGSSHSLPSADASPVEILNDYVRLFAATCLHRVGDHAGAEVLLLALGQQTESLLTVEARELLGRIYLQWAKPHQAIEIYRRLRAEFPSGDDQARYSQALATAYQQAERPAEAVALWESIIRHHPASREALPAVKAYRGLHDGELSGEMLFQVGWVHFHHRQYEPAMVAWDGFVDQNPWNRLAPEALFLSARAAHRCRRFSESRRRCDRLLSTYPHSDWLTSAHFLLARCDEGEGLTAAAVRRYRQFVTTYPWSQLADDALWRLARIFERDGDLTAAEEEYWELSQRYASRSDVQSALWRAGLYALFRGQTATALHRLNLLLQRDADGALTHAARYWIARAHLIGGHEEQGLQQMYRVLECEDVGYYANLARRWLNISSGDPLLDRANIADLLSHFQGGPMPPASDDLWLRLSKGQQLVRLGLLSRARRELANIHQMAHRHPALVDSLLGLYEQYELYGDAVRLATKLQTHRPETEFHRILQVYLYPLSYQELVQAEADKYQLDPFLVLALMRTESLFDPLAISPAGAKGLMQIMPATGQEIAHQLGAPSDVLPIFFDPEWSIRMGVYYLWQQYQAYHGQVEFALAAYNAGPGNVNRWLRRLDGVDPDLFVELIDFRETRQFIKKVLAAHVQYRSLWSQKE
jgi:soluble lytic murein transglycosylase